MAEKWVFRASFLVLQGIYDYKLNIPANSFTRILCAKKVETTMVFIGISWVSTRRQTAATHVWG